MLSYRHSYHAGNHADLIKHLVQTLLIENLKCQNQPFVYIDTHSGGGLYDLSDEQANKTGEYKDGIAKLVLRGFNKSMPKPYTEMVMALNADQPKLRFYPGSPLIAQKLLRKQDQIKLFELHNAEAENLFNNMQGDARVKIFNQNGFDSLAGILPPEQNRGLVLIDPSYEVKQDYQDLVDAVSAALAKWPQGIFAIWYPVLGKARDQSQMLLEHFAKAASGNLLLAELAVEAQQQEFGMHGSGMAVFNAPENLQAEIEKHLKFIHQRIAKKVDGEKQGQYRTEWIKK